MEHLKKKEKEGLLALLLQIIASFGGGSIPLADNVTFFVKFSIVASNGNIGHIQIGERNPKILLTIVFRKFTEKGRM